MIADSLRDARDAFNRCEYHRAHELFEHDWLKADPAYKPYYQGLIQVAAAYYKLGQGQVGPAVRLLHRAIPKLEAWQAHEGPAELLRHLRATLRDLEGGGDARTAYEQAPCLSEAVLSVESGF